MILFIIIAACLLIGFVAGFAFCAHILEKGTH